MNLLHQDLARARQASRHEQSAQQRQAVAYVAHRRWQRKAERAALRARLALASL